jgi:hypothetical protein
MNDEDAISVNRGRHYAVEPQYFEFCEYGCLGDGNRLIWDPMTQTLEIRDYAGIEAAKKLPTPTRTQWKAFWFLLEQAQVWNWQSKYEDETGICDGGGWRLDASFAGRFIKTGGYNAYPDTQGTNYLPGSPFDILSTAILLLSHGEFPGLED